MKKKYRMKVTEKWDYTRFGKRVICPTFAVQIRTVFGIWITIKSFRDAEMPDFANREAHELLEKLEEK